MNPAVITYLGFFVAVLIIVWAAVELSRRFYKRKKPDARSITTWVPLQPTAAETGNDEHNDDLPPPRSQQNGHYSESKKL